MDRKRPQLLRRSTSMALAMGLCFCLCCCGLESSEKYIREPSAIAEKSGEYAFRHDAAIAAADELYGYEILYRLYTSSTAMENDKTAIEGYIGSFQTMVYQKMEALGYKRVTSGVFNQDVLVSMNEFAALAVDNVTISVVFTETSDYSQVNLKIIDDNNSSLNAQKEVFRGIVSQTIPNQGKGFDEIKGGDADIAGIPTENCFMQAYVFAVGINDDFTKFYSIPSKLGSNIQLDVIM